MCANVLYPETAEYANTEGQEKALAEQALYYMTRNEQMATTIYQRDLMLRTGTRIAEILLSPEDEASIETAIITALELISVSADLDRAIIWRNEMIDGELHFVMAHMWMSGFGRKHSQTPLQQKYSYRDRPGWERMFSRGEYFNGPFSELLPGERDFLGPYEIKSFVAIPLFLHDRFWGFVSLADCKNERTFPEDEINILRWVSLMIASAIDRGAQAAMLKKAHEHTRLLLDAVPMACHLWNRDLVIFDCNEENVRLFNLKDKNQIKDFSKYSPLYQPDGQLSSEKSMDCIEQVFEKGRLVIDWMHQTVDGALIPAEVTLVRVPYGDDFLVAGYARDLREYNKMMEEIEVNKAQLEAANNAKSNFLANMSHEMRTPLNAVIGLSGLTLEIEGLDDEAKTNLEKIYNAGATLLNIVNDILDISKIEAGKFELVFGEYDTPSLINDTITQNILRIGDKPIEFRLDLSPDIPTRLYGDELRIKQILNNILSNAFKYTKEGIVEFGFRSEPIEDEGGDSAWITAWVRDTGIGIRPEDIGRLFSDYSQVDTQANHTIEGTGLGLALTKKMLDRMGGTIKVESEYGKGSVFTLGFRQKIVTGTPIGETVVNNLKSVRYSDNMRNEGMRLKHTKMPYAKVLVVDDNPTNLDVAKGLLKQYGMRVDCMTNGQEAIAAIHGEKTKYDAIFMDHMMPGMDGIEAMQHIRNLGTEYASAIPIIMLTANAIVGNEQMFLEKGFQAFLSKPINLLQLDHIVKQWVRDKSRENQTYEDQAPEEQRVCEMPEIEGIDAKKALGLYAGLLETYTSVLRSYADNTPEVVKTLRRFAEAKNMQGYSICVHGLKGSSAGIGAEDIKDRAFELETLSKDGNLSRVLELNEAFLRDTETLVGRIGAWLDEHKREAERPRKAAPDPAVLEELRRSLSDYDLGGIENAMELLGGADYETEADLVPWLEKRITDSDFEEAAKRVADILTSTLSHKSITGEMEIGHGR